MLNFGAIVPHTGMWYNSNLSASLRARGGNQRNSTPNPCSRSNNASGGVSLPLSFSPWPNSLWLNVRTSLNWDRETVYNHDLVCKQCYYFGCQLVANVWIEHRLQTGTWKNVKINREVTEMLITSYRNIEWNNKKDQEKTRKIEWLNMTNKRIKYKICLCHKIRNKQLFHLYKRIAFQSGIDDIDVREKYTKTLHLVISKVLHVR